MGLIWILDDEKCSGLYISPNVVMVVKLRRVITMGQACIERGNSKFYRILEERTFWKCQLGRSRRSGNIALRGILEK
jgi:hypothetical protein